MIPKHEVEPQLNDAVEDALIDIFLHLHDTENETPIRVLNAVEEVEAWARQRYHPRSKKVMEGARSSGRLHGLAGFVLGIYCMAIFLLPEILGLTCG